MFKLSKDEKFTKALDKTFDDLYKVSYYHLLKRSKLKLIDKTKPHLYFCQGKWYYLSAYMGHHYIKGPSEKRNNAAMLWCWNQNYNKPIDKEIVFS